MSDVQLSAEDLTNDELSLLRAIHLWTRIGVVDASTGQRTKVSPVPWYLLCMTAATWRDERDVKVTLSALRDDGLIEHGLHYINGTFALPDGKTIKVRHKVLGRERIAWSARIEMPGGESNLLSQMDIGTHPNAWTLTAKGKKVLRDSPATTGGHAVAGETTTQVRAAAKTITISASKHRRRRSQERTPAPLTTRQAEVAHVVGECKGNLAEAARRLGLDRKTVEQHYNAAMRKLGKAGVRSQKATNLLRKDRRGQFDVAAEDDQRLG